MAKFSTDTAWWAFNLVNQYQDLNFALINKEVRAKAHKIEADAMRSIVAWEKEVQAEQDDGLDVLTARSNAFVEKHIAEWWSFAWSLVAKYRGYVVTHNATSEDANAQMYPAWWLKSPEVGFTSWSPTGPFHGTVFEAQTDASAGYMHSLHVILTQALDVHSGPSLSFVALPLMVAIVFITHVAHKAGVQKGRKQAFADCHYEQQV
jgi:hypothetical protein